MPRVYDSDHAGSEDMDEILAMSRSSRVSRTNVAGSSRNTASINEASYLAKPELLAKLGKLEAEINSIDQDISDLQRARANLVSKHKEVEREYDLLASRGAQTSTHTSHHSRKKPSSSLVDYREQFEWTPALKAKMNNVFGIKEFRLCQEGVCNAAMDGRDVVCIMPTGGGKSLTYQLPAIMSRGVTLVISPLLSLITDQILHLRQNGIEAVMLTGATSKEESRSIFDRLKESTRTTAANAQSEIKLCYVTPEKIAKSKTFTSMLEKVASAGRLARIVLDEAHCVSQLGHDFRPDYKKLSILRQLFPRVPITALSATCPPKVLADLTKTLRLAKVVDGNAASKEGTVHFTAPLYRKNLHYTVVSKPSSASAIIDTMAEYVTSTHANHSGIVYCLSKKDTETVAQGLIEAGIKAGVYHSDVNDDQKQRLHVRWRSGEIQVVCATIAFGLGIDKPDVRFVLHHSMSKSLDGFYQESGRAGRDGNDADCVLYYRGQDATRLSALICGELEGQEKLYDMLRFAQDLKECRKIQFANYFSASASLSLSAWQDDVNGALTRCGHCDNCTRPADSIETRDVTLESWQILKVADQAAKDGARLTVAMLSDLVRGAGGGGYVAGGGRKKGGRKGAASKEKVELDLDDLCGGKITMPKTDVEALVIELLGSGMLKEEFHSTAYSINVYVTLGHDAIRLTRLSRQRVEAGEGARISHTFQVKSTKKKPRTSLSRSKTATPKASAKGKAKAQVDSEEDITEDEDNAEFEPPPKTKSKPKAQSIRSKPTQAKLSLTSLSSTTPQKHRDEDVPWNIDDVDMDEVEDFEPQPGRSSSHTYVGGPDNMGSEEDDSSDADEWTFSLAAGSKRKASALPSQTKDIPGSIAKKAKFLAKVDDAKSKATAKKPRLSVTSEVVELSD